MKQGGPLGGDHQQIELYHTLVIDPFFCKKMVFVCICSRYGNNYQQLNKKTHICTDPCDIKETFLLTVVSERADVGAEDWKFSSLPSKMTGEDGVDGVGSRYEIILDRFPQIFGDFPQKSKIKTIVILDLLRRPKKLGVLQLKLK